MNEAVLDELEESVDLREQMRLRTALGSAFTPSAPVSKLDLFSGRLSQLQRVTDVIFQRGQHAVIYGERGVGKTSLANVLAEWLEHLKQHNYQVVRHNCAATSNFNSIWEGIFRELSFKRNTIAGFSEQTSLVPMSSYVPANAGSEDVRFLLQQTGSSTIVVIDEYDRVKDSATPGLLADTIKSLSDHAVDATLIIIGVADSIDELIAEHKSVERALVQVQMPRMSDPELFSIIERGFQSAKMSVEEDAKRHIAALSQGLPHNTHELGLLSGYSAIEKQKKSANRLDVEDAIKKAVSNAQQTIVNSYCTAISSPHNNLYKEILFAAALAPTDELGYFAAGDLRKPLSAITKKSLGIDQYMRHLNSFCEADRAKILERKGERRRYRFRFTESIMEPYVIMKGIADGLMDEEDVVDFESGNYISPSL